MSGKLNRLGLGVMLTLAVAPLATAAATAKTSSNASSIASNPVDPGTLGAVDRVVVPGAALHAPYIGEARFDWAFQIELRADSVRSIYIQGFAPVHLFLKNGSCISVSPKNIRGNAVGLEMLAEPCPTPPKPTDGAPTAEEPPLELGKASVISERTFQIRNNFSKRSTDLYQQYPGGEVEKISTVPLTGLAVGSLPGLHGAGYAVTIVGARSGKLVIVGLDVPLRQTP